MLFQNLVDSDLDSMYKAHQATQPVIQVVVYYSDISLVYLNIYFTTYLISRNNQATFYLPSMCPNTGL